MSGWLAVVASGRGDRGLPALGLLLLLGGCRSSTLPEPAPTGQLAAVLSGAVEGELLAVGAEPSPGRPLAPFASARRGGLAGALGVMGVQARGAVHDAILLDLRGVGGPGAYPARGTLQYGGQGRDLAGARRFEIVEGEVRIASLDDGRVRGAFEATAVEVRMSFPPAPPADTVRIGSGRFDVPILSQRAWSASQSGVIMTMRPTREPVHVAYLEEPDFAGDTVRLAAAVVWLGRTTASRWSPRRVVRRVRSHFGPLGIDLHLKGRARAWTGSSAGDGEQETLFDPERRIVRVLGRDYPIPDDGRALVLLIDERAGAGRRPAVVVHHAAIAAAPAAGATADDPAGAVPPWLPLLQEDAAVREFLEPPGEAS